MWLPFSREFDDLFRKDRSIWFKMVGAAAATDLVVIISGALDAPRGQPDIRPEVIAAVLIVVGIAGAGVALVLSLKDIVERRDVAGQKVSWLLRILFLRGILSRILWAASLFAISLLAVMLLFVIVRF